MKAISMVQPYAWLFVHGYLKVDDRSWPTSYRGPLAIHASLRSDEAYYRFVTERLGWVLPPLNAMKHGGIVGIAHLNNCILPVKASEFQADPSRAHFGAPGYYGFVLERARAVSFLRCRGNRGLFDLTDAQVASLT
jgi:hypothetical protein